MKNTIAALFLSCSLSLGLNGANNRLETTLVNLRNEANRIISSDEGQKSLIVANSFTLSNAQPNDSDSSNIFSESIDTMFTNINTVLNHLAAATEAEMKKNNIAPLFCEVFVPENNEWYIRGPVTDSISFNPFIAGYKNETAQENGVYVNQIQNVKLSLENKMILISAELAHIEQIKQVTDELLTTDNTNTVNDKYDSEREKRLAVIGGKMGVGLGLILVYLLHNKEVMDVFITSAGVTGIIMLLASSYELATTKV